MRVALTLCLLVLSLGAAVSAQEAPACPAGVLLDLSRAASACYRLGREEVCSGNGAISAAGFDGAALITQPGSRAAAGAVAALTVTSDADDLGVALLNLRADLPALTERSAAVVAFGAVSLTNLVEPLPQVIAVATGAANIRSAPRANADIVGQLAVTNGVILNGRTADGRWLRAQVRNSDTYGWVTADVLNVQGNAAALAVADANTRVQRAFQTMTLTIGDATFCDGALPGGLLVQAPSLDTPVTLTINDETITLAGTAFISGGAELTVSVIAGHALVGDGQFVPAGAQATSHTGAQPFAPDTLRALPLNLLPVSVRLPASITAADIDQLAADYATAQAAAAAPPIAHPTTDPNICRRETRRAVTLYAGPGRFYEAINELRAGAPVVPVLETTDPDGRVWWQLRGSNWLEQTAVRETGDCPPVPRTQIVPPPRENTLSLETCETTNGPLRAGQRVTIQFTPPAWDNWGEAHDAVIVDPGRISIGARTYRAQATAPIQIGTVGVDDRYLRRFYIVWTAEPGTFRIVGDRLSYEPICTLTVPVG